MGIGWGPLRFLCPTDECPPGLVFNCLESGGVLAFECDPCAGGGVAPIPPDQIPSVQLWLDTTKLAKGGGGQLEDGIAGNNGTLNNFAGNPFSGLAPPNALATDSVTFDGVDDNITIDSEILFDSTGPDPFSISVWCRAPSSGIRAIFTGLPNQDNNGLTMWSGFSDVGFFGQALNFFDNPVPFQANAWFHVGASRAADGNCNVFVNGIASASNPLPDAGRFFFGRIGQRNAGNNWNGQLAQIELFDSVLTQTQFQQIFDGSRTTVPVPIHQWLMDSLTTGGAPAPGEQFETWEDAIGNSDAVQATAGNQPTYQASPRRVVFDGVDDFMRLAQMHTATGPFTSVVWVRSREE